MAKNPSVTIKKSRGGAECAAKRLRIVICGGTDMCLWRGIMCRVEPRAKSIWWDTTATAFVEVRTRTTREDQAALPELSVTAEKQHVGRTARRFLSERQVKECPMRFDLVAIEEVPGSAPAIRLYKNAFRSQM